MNVLVVSKLIINLLETNECVTIPEFGAFVLNPSGSKFEIAKNRFTPPGRKISFNRSIQINDGLLASALSNQEGISYEDAIVYLKGFVSSIQSELKIKYNFDFGEIGSFYYTEENLLKFEPSQNILTSDFGLESFHLTPLSSNLVDGKELIDTNLVTGNVEVHYVSKLSRWGKIGWAVAALPFIAYLAWVPAQSGVLDRQKNFQFTDLNPFRTAPCEVYVNRPAGLVELDFNSDGLLFDNFDESTFQFAPPETTNVVMEVPVEVYKEGNYQIIGGCFSKKTNANRMVTSLKSKGYSAFILDNKNGLYRVSYGGFASIEEARRSLKKVKANDSSSAWLLKN